DLAGLLEIGLDLPPGADVPAEDDPGRRLVGEHARPPAFAPIHAPVVDVAAHTPLEHRLRDRDIEHVVLARLDAVEVLREYAERTLDWRIDDDLRPYRRLLCLCGHETSSV